MTVARPPAPSAGAETDSRHAAVWRALADVLAAGGPDGAPLIVVDAGGGSGGFAVPLARRGHRVTVVDPSQDALAALARRAADAGVADLVTGRQGDLTELAAVAGATGAAAGGADLLLCHAVLDQVANPERALTAAVRVLRPGGWLSLLVPGLPGAVLARALAGRFADAARLLTGPAAPTDHAARGGGAGPGGKTSPGWHADPGGQAGSGGHAAAGGGAPAGSVVPARHTGPGEPIRRFDTAQAMALARAAGAEVVTVHGVRVFADLAGPPPPGRGEDGREPPAAWADQLADLETVVSALPPYRDLAAELHILARRPGRRMASRSAAGGSATGRVVAGRPPTSGAP